MTNGKMKRTYSIVSIDGITGAKLQEFLATHKIKYPSVISFVDAAVNEKMDKENAITEAEYKTNMEELSQINPYTHGGGV